MSIHQPRPSTPASTNGGDGAPLTEELEALAREYGNRFLLEPPPDDRLPEHGMRSDDAMRLTGQGGRPARTRPQTRQDRRRVLATATD